MMDEAISSLPEEHREVIVLHLLGELPFRRIAALKEISINTAVSRYRYGLGKLRSAMNGSNHECDETNRAR